jgi:Cu(I)/Ag(I) efflux system membrane fusion protein
MTRAQTLSLAIAAVLAALAVGWMAGRGTHDDARTSTGTATNARKALYYRNPMGSDTSPVPKKDPMGMDYVPVYAGDESPGAPGTVVMSPDKVQALGVRTEPVRREALAGRVRASGTVQVDETRQFVIAPRFEGWVERLYANQTGMHVRAGQPLLAVYSPQLAAAQQEYRLADAAARTLARSDAASGASMARLRDSARERLRNWDIGEAQIARLGRDGAPRNLVLTSPADGVVVEKPVVQGARFQPGDTILRLADLSTVWVIAKVPVAQAGGIVTGQPARFDSVALPGQTFSGKVTFVQPVVDAATRTVDVRIAFPNRGGDLRPGLFGTVLLEQPTSQPTLTVPRSAVLDSGTRQLVLVQTAPGRFAPREVTLGQRAGDRVEVLVGLAEGEPVVVSANFLIDAESNLQSALAGLGGHAGHGAPAPGTDAPQDAHAARDTTGTPDPQAGHGARPAAPVPAAPRPAAPEPTAPPPAQPADPHAGHGPAPAEPAERVMPAPDNGHDNTSHEGH